LRCNRAERIVIRQTEVRSAILTPMKMDLPGNVTPCGGKEASLLLKLLSVLAIAALMALTVWTGGW